MLRTIPPEDRRRVEENLFDAVASSSHRPRAARLRRRPRSARRRRHHRPAAFAIEEPAGGPGESADQPAESASARVPLNDVPSDADLDLAPALQPSFGLGKNFDVSVRPHGERPADLGLAGALFRATPTPATGTVYDCTTDVWGTCSFDGPGTSGIPDFLATVTWKDASLPAGSYTLTQVSASPGLAPTASSTAFSICSSWFCGSSRPTIAVGNNSLFRTALVTTVTDSATGAPVGCAEYELTGPDYPHNDRMARPAAFEQDDIPAACLPAATTAPTTAPAPESTQATGSDAGEPPAPATDTAGEECPTEAPAEETTGSATGGSTEVTQDGTGQDPAPVMPFARDDAPVTFGTQTSAPDGTLTIRGWFLPAGGYLLTPTAMPAGYTADPADAFGIATTARGAAAGLPAVLTRTASTHVAGADLGPDAPTTDAPTADAPTTDVAAAAPSMATGTAPVTAAPAGNGAALATTGTPVETMALLGGGLVVLGGGALAAGEVLRRRDRQRV